MTLKLLWKLHSWLGLIAGLGLICIGLTGSILVFHDEIDVLLSPQAIKVTPEVKERLPLDALLAAIRKALPDHEAGGWQVSTRPHRADQVWVVKHGESESKFVWLDPFTGVIRGMPMSAESAFTGWLLNLHSAFFADHAGMLVVGLFAVLLCLLGITGVWLYRGFWKHFFTLRWGRGARLFFSDLHKMVGISSVGFNLILGITGAWWNLSHVIGEFISGHQDETAAVTRHFYSDSLSLDALLQQAKTRRPDYELGFVSLPENAEADITFYGRGATYGKLRSPYGCSIVFDRQTGALKSMVDLQQAGAWAQIEDAFTPLHYGTFGGLPVKILWCVLGLAPGVLAVSGFMIWYRRRNRRSVS